MGRGCAGGTIRGSSIEIGKARGDESGDELGEKLGEATRIWMPHACRGEGDSGVDRPDSGDGDDDPDEDDDLMLERLLGAGGVGHSKMQAPTSGSLNRWLRRPAGLGCELVPCIGCEPR